MRILTLVFVLLLTVIITATAFGEATRPDRTGDVSVETISTVPLPQTTHLRLSPLFIEILVIEEQARETERFLLKELAETTDAVEAGRIVRRLERLDTDRHLSILNLRMVHARKTGHFDLALRLRAAMVAVMNDQMQAAQSAP